MGNWITDDDKFLLDLELKKKTIQEQYDALFRMLSKWGRMGRIIEVGVEIDGQQQLNVFALERWWWRRISGLGLLDRKGKLINRKILSKAGGSKHERFKYMMPSFENNKMWFPNEIRLWRYERVIGKLKYVGYTTMR